MIIDETQYETMIRKALESDNAEEVRTYLTTICPECDKEVTPDVERATREDGFYHRMMDNWVIVGCEGYRVVNPNIVGQKSEFWHDWRN